jgi:ribosomal protein S18 acetylase RimI-like enzyme
MIDKGVVQKLTFTEEDIAAVEALNAVCNAFEGLHMRLVMQALRTRTGEQVQDLLYYADNKLVGFLSMEGAGDGDREVVAMVHPAYRRRGIGTVLLEAAGAIYRPAGVKQFILICEESSPSGRAFVDSIGAKRDFAEHQMELETLQVGNTPTERLVVRPAGADERTMLISVLATGFGDSSEMTTRIVDMFLKKSNRQFYLAERDGEPVGCLNVDGMDGEPAIYAFTILPDYRGRGYGRQLLEEVIHRLQAGGVKKVLIEVETLNASALGLYQSCGFRIVTTYGYYKLNI